MALRMGEHALSVVFDLVYEPTPFRLRGHAFGHLFVDTLAALLVWEPRRVVPMYAVPVDDLDAELVPPTTADDTPAELPAILGPENFRWHSCPGRAATVRVPGGSCERAAFRPDDPDLSDYVILDFAPFVWTEEEEGVTGHPHDPFKRIDVRPTSRHVVVALEGTTLADSRAPMMLAETLAPVRWYLPRDDVRMDLLEHTSSTSTCAYKGQARYWSYHPAGRTGRDVAWSYEQPLPEAHPVRGHLCFYNERVDLVVDGMLLERPRTPWSLDGQAT